MGTVLALLRPTDTTLHHQPCSRLTTDLGTAAPTLPLRSQDHSPAVIRLSYETARLSLALKRTLSEQSQPSIPCAVNHLALVFCRPPEVMIMSDVRLSDSSVRFPTSNMRRRYYGTQSDRQVNTQTYACSSFMPACTCQIARLQNNTSKAHMGRLRALTHAAADR